MFIYLFFIWLRTMVCTSHTCSTCNKKNVDRQRNLHEDMIQYCQKTNKGSCPRTFCLSDAHHLCKTTFSDLWPIVSVSAGWEIQWCFQQRKCSRMLTSKWWFTDREMKRSFKKLTAKERNWNTLTLRMNEYSVCCLLFNSSGVVVVIVVIVVEVVVILLIWVCFSVFVSFFFFTH